LPRKEQAAVVLIAVNYYSPKLLSRALKSRAIFTQKKLQASLPADGDN